MQCHYVSSVCGDQDCAQTKSLKWCQAKTSFISFNCPCPLQMYWNMPVLKGQYWGRGVLLAKKWLQFGFAKKNCGFWFSFGFTKLIAVSFFSSVFCTVCCLHSTGCLQCWIGPTNCQPKWLRTGSEEVRHEEKYFDCCWKMNCEWDDMKTVPKLPKSVY